MPRETYRAHPAQLAQIRDVIRDIGARSGLSDERVGDLVLAVSEAAANAIVHSGSPSVTLSWMHAGGRIEVEVADQGVFRRRVPMPEFDGTGGHGIPLMMALVDEILILEGTPETPGTTVRLVVNSRQAVSH